MTLSTSALSVDLLRESTRVRSGLIRKLLPDVAKAAKDPLTVRAADD
jgi:hypothetical protein